MAITYVTGDATQPIGSGVRIIAHICNDRGGWGRGFVRAISARWSRPEADYKAWFRGADFDFALGKIQLVQVQSTLYIANMIAQQGYQGLNNPVPLCYDSLDECLKKLYKEAKNLKASVHMPKIGTGLAGGDWSKIEALIEENLKDIEVLVYLY